MVTTVTTATMSVGGMGLSRGGREAGDSMADCEEGMVHVGQGRVGEIGDVEGGICDRWNTSFWTGIASGSP